MIFVTTLVTPHYRFAGCIKGKVAHMVTLLEATTAFREGRLVQTQCGQHLTLQWFSKVTDLPVCTGCQLAVQSKE